MNPEQIALLTAICQVIDKIGTWPLGVIVLLITIGPWVMSLILGRAQEKRLEAIRQMYESNVELVKGYERTTRALEQNNQALMDMIAFNTSKWAEAIEKIDTNQYCPGNRTQKVRQENVL